MRQRSAHPLIRRLLVSAIPLVTVVGGSILEDAHLSQAATALPGSEFPVHGDSCCYVWPTASPRGRAIAVAQAKEAARRAAHPTAADLRERREQQRRRLEDSLNRVRTGGELTRMDYLVGKFYVSNECDANGIPDSIDISVGAAEDANHNGIIDSCDPDSSVRANATSAAWRAAQAVRDSVFLRARHLEVGLVEIDYALSASANHVAMRVADAHGADISRLLDAKRPRGAYSLVWNKLDDRGRAVPPGRYWIELGVGERHFRRLVQWR